MADRADGSARESRSFPDFARCDARCKGVQYNLITLRIVVSPAVQFTSERVGRIVSVAHD